MSMVQPQPASIVPNQLSNNADATSVAMATPGMKTTSASVNGTVNGDAPPAAPTPPVKSNIPQNRRLDLEKMIEEFSSLLGKDNWSKYAQVISLFILGKLSRKELVNELDLLLTPQDQQAIAKKRNVMIRLHNQLLLGILANSLRDSPLGNADGAWGFNNSSAQANKKKLNKHNSQIETYKKIVMSLPAKDRNRLKMITKEAGKRGFVLCSVLQARLHNIPKIPIVTNPETLKRVKLNNLQTPLEWSQEIVNGFSAPLATESYSLPDTDSLYLRMVSIAREHGLVGAVDGRCVEILTLALEYYLKTIIESAIDTVRYREKKYSDYYDLNEDGIYQDVSTKQNQNKEFGVTDLVENQEPREIISLTNEDLAHTFNLFPNLVEPSGAFLRLSSSELLNDDELVTMKSRIDDLPEFLDDKPNFTPVDDKNVGSREELNWLIKDILTNE